MTQAAEGQDFSGGERAARLVLSLGAAGEIGVGAAVLIFPSMVAVILGAPLEATGLFVARMFGTAILALGTTWWLAGRAPGGVKRCMTGFLLYNLALGALFLLHAVRQVPPAPLVWAVGVLHVLLGIGFGAAIARSVSSRA